MGFGFIRQLFRLDAFRRVKPALNVFRSSSCYVISEVYNAMLIKILLLTLLMFGLIGCERPPPKKMQEGSGRATAISPLPEKLTLIRPEFMTTQPFELGGSCNMETLNGKLWGATIVSIDPALPFVVSGWGADAKQGTAPTQVYLRLQNSKAQEFYALAPNVPRGDLRQHFGKAFYEKSGYSVTVDAQGLPPGEYQAMIVMNVDGRTMLCASGRKLILEGGKK